MLSVRLRDLVWGEDLQEVVSFHFEVSLIRLLEACPGLRSCRHLLILCHGKDRK
jgi:hypothetical protein